jgi:hypothetical protein
MAQFIKPPGYGEPQFRPTRLEREAAKRDRKAKRASRREGNDEDHATLLRQLPCCVTGITPARQIHHLKAGPARQERGIGMKATHKWGVPLSFVPHILGVERVGSRQEHAWFRDNGIDDPYELAAALYRETGDLERMTRIVQAHMGRPRRGR